MRRRALVNGGPRDSEFKCLWVSELQVSLFLPFQDTVVALQALAKYAALTYDTEGVAEVRVRSQRGFGRKFQVSYQNRLLVQEAALTEVPGKFLVQARGSCCVFTRVGSHRPSCDNLLLIILLKTSLHCISMQRNVH